MKHALGPLEDFDSPQSSMLLRSECSNGSTRLGEAVSGHLEASVPGQRLSQ